MTLEILNSNDIEDGECELEDGELAFECRSDCESDSSSMAEDSVASDCTLTEEESDDEFETFQRGALPVASCKDFLLRPDQTPQSGEEYLMFVRMQRNSLPKVKASASIERALQQEWSKVTCHSDNELRLPADMEIFAQNFQTYKTNLLESLVADDENDKSLFEDEKSKKIPLHDNDEIGWWHLLFVKKQEADCDAACETTADPLKASLDIFSHLSNKTLCMLLKYHRKWAEKIWRLDRVSGDKVHPTSEEDVDSASALEPDSQLKLMFLYRLYGMCCSITFPLTGDEIFNLRTISKTLLASRSANLKQTIDEHERQIACLINSFVAIVIRTYDQKDLLSLLK